MSEIGVQEVHAANPDPDFWIALGKAGSGENLVLLAMAATGVSSADWDAIADYLNSNPELTAPAGGFSGPPPLRDRRYRRGTQPVTAGSDRLD